ncbi:MAG: dienelactone hydrolase family protein [Planctomycetes bacterium]|nr:dienelactone hydrolase family protein [Planctomycetota bacterium]
MADAVRVPCGPVRMCGDFDVPAGARGVVAFAHGSGSSRHSPRNRHVAAVFRRARMGTLLLDLLTEAEEDAYETRFDIDLLTDRLCAAVDWLGTDSSAKDLPVGLFGASTGAAAALRAAAAVPSVRAVVSRGGGVDLAAEFAAMVRCPTLLIVGGWDEDVLEMNRQVFELLGCEKRLAVIPKATHLFEEPGALDDVANLAAEWFGKWL